MIIGCFIAAILVCDSRLWYADDPLYMQLKVIQQFSNILIPILLLIGAIVIMWLALHRQMSYVSDVIDAAKKVSQLDDEIIELPDELIEAETELNLAKEQSRRNFQAAREAEQRKNDLIVYLAHDLKTPLTSVIGYLTLLRDEPEISEEFRTKYTGIALDKAERLEELINEFFEITRFNLTNISLEMETISLTRMLEQIAYEFYPILAEKGLDFQLDFQPNVEILCDPDKLERVFDNLIRNAVNYSYPRTRIDLSMKLEEQNAIVQVHNHGKTIPKDKLARIFEQFFRLDSSRSTATGGSGLGLAISKEIAELHGGTITAESENEQITFTLTLPVSR